MRAKLESIPLSEVAKFRGWSSRRSLIVLTLVAVLVAGIALVALQSSGDTPDPTASRGPNHAQATVPGARAPETAAHELAAAPDNPARTSPTPPAADASHGSPASNAKELRPSKAASPSKPASGSGTKDYGI